jgi:hypothetical protein
MATQPERVSVELINQWRAFMNFRALIVLGFAAFVAQPALAQTAPTNVPATIDSLLAAGYEIKAVNVMSDAALKEVYAGQTVTSSVFITLQKGTSVAVCAEATLVWITLADAQMKDTTRCWQR